jgi:HEAT repeat protein
MALRLTILRHMEIIKFSIHPGGYISHKEAKMSTKKCPRCGRDDSGYLDYMRCFYCGHVYIRRQQIILISTGIILIAASVLWLANGTSPQSGKMAAYGLAGCGVVFWLPVIIWLILLVRSEPSVISEQANIRRAQAKGNISELVTKLGHKYEDVQLAAVEALVMLGRPSLEPLVATLTSQFSKPDPRPMAAAALGQIGDPAAVSPLMAALRNNSSEVRQGAATALGLIRDSKATEALIHLLADKESGVRKATLDSLNRINRAWPQLPSTQAAITNFVSALESAETRVGAVDALNEASPNWRQLEPVRRMVELHLAKIAHKTQDIWDRVAAGKALAQLGEPGAIQALLSLAQDISQPGSAKFLVDSLAQLLIWSAPTITTEDLQILAHLENLSYDRYPLTDDDWVPPTKIKLADCSSVRLLASEALIRRQGWEPTPEELIHRQG